MDGQEVVQGITILKAAIDMVRSALGLISKREKVGLIPVYRPEFRRHGPLLGPCEPFDDLATVRGGAGKLDAAETELIGRPIRR